MKIVFLIGNGFDINLGMKTRYADFYSSYHKKKSESELIDGLKSTMRSDYPNWVDLELALGQYTENISSIEEFDEIYEDICNSLADYLNDEEAKFNFDSIDRAKFLNYICFPEQSLSRGDQDEIIEFKSRWKTQRWGIDIITFNYTQSIEKILKNPKFKLEIGNHDGVPIVLNGLEHIHGFTDNRMIMGVNDISQIKNEYFHYNDEVLEGLVKPRCNSIQRHNVDSDCVQKISNSNLICIFGSSLGETDNFWWELICEQLRRDCRLIIFYRGQEILPRFEHKKSRIIRAVKERFLSKVDLADDEKLFIYEKIYVTVNSGFFGGL